MFSVEKSCALIERSSDWIGLIAVS
jgi:hypothetical protein